MSKLYKISALFSGAAISMLLIGCASSKNKDNVNALSIKTSGDTVTEIRQAINTIQGFEAAPEIASNTFEINSYLLIDSGQLMEDYDRPLDDAESKLFDQYTLQLRGDECGVYFAKDDKFIPLTNIKCRPNPIQD
ncbi:hypothetical protein [Vibrio sp. AND4]|uniref:hypothetical protein n=1 Tax=Vibrio sp. AND4 TaxID=314289 RepID=UPI00015EFB6D|nr:hypothetical protein [Vibrio sp. AND4]EDP59909.1 hypothetical protein AND4_00833 [Vibrio sp. AND4]